MLYASTDSCIETLYTYSNRFIQSLNKLRQRLKSKRRQTNLTANKENRAELRLSLICY